MEKVVQIEKTVEWQAIGNSETTKIRAYFDLLDKTAIRDSLIKEQHGLCAYCMRRIRNDSSMVIEHYKSIKNKDDALDYQNMLGCCDGGRSFNDLKKKYLCCDAAKGDTALTIGPWDGQFVNTIRYSSDGKIYTFPKNQEAERQINEVLCLTSDDFFA